VNKFPSEVQDIIERRLAAYKDLHGLRTRSQNVIINMWENLCLPHPILPSDVAAYSEAEWLRQSNSGTRTIADISRWLDERGLRMWTREAQRTNDLEIRERAELARLKAKYEPDQVKEITK
jgi:hypothetical protein